MEFIIIMTTIGIVATATLFAGLSVFAVAYVLSSAPAHEDRGCAVCGKHAEVQTENSQELCADCYIASVYIELGTTQKETQ